jgi:hypothetical protein
MEAALQFFCTRHLGSAIAQGKGLKKCQTALQCMQDAGKQIFRLLKTAVLVGAPLYARDHHLPLMGGRSQSSF